MDLYEDGVQVFILFFLWYRLVATVSAVFEYLHSWMNEWCIYIALFVYCCKPKTLYNHGGGGGLSSTTTSVQHPLWWCDGCHRTTAAVCSPHTSYRWRGERVIETIKWMGIIRRPWLTRASGGNLARTPGLHPYSLREVPWDFNDITESQDLGLMSHPKDSAFYKYSVPITILRRRTHRKQGEHPLLASLTPLPAAT